jgi:hypothetical protein
VSDPLRVLTTYEDHEQTLQETAAGAMADVQTSINPLSTLTPGFLRRLFGVFSSGPAIGTAATPADGPPVDPYPSNENAR